MKPNDRCAVCHHTLAEHGIGVVCFGKNWDEQNSAPPCRCEGFVEKKRSE